MGGGGGRLLPYMGHIGMCRTKGYGFFSRFGLKKGMNFDDFGLK